MKKFIISVLVLSAAFTSCSTDLDINTSPDFPTDVPVSSQLTAAEIGLAGGEGASLAIIGGMWSQYWTQSNTANQYKDIDAYSIGTADYNFAWDAMYDALGDIRNVKRKALAEGNWNYYLMATVLETHASQVLTDFYGDIPYQEASNKDILQPRFNSQQEVYDLMIADLNDALSRDLSQSVGTPPGDNDYIFHGVMDNWVKFANTMKLRIFMRQTEVRPAVASAGITALFSSGAQFLDVDAGIIATGAGEPIFVDAINQSNPLYEYNNRRLNVATNLRRSTTLSSFLDDKGDARLGQYYGAGVALNQGDYGSTIGNVSVVTLKATTPVYFISLEESLFLQAEAMERYGLGSGQAMYEAGVAANFAKYGLDATTVLAGSYAYPAAGTFDDKLEAIITQKWVASFPGNGFEAFFETNRTGYPRTSTVEQSDPGYIPGQLAYSVNGSTDGAFPKRIVYPLSERNANQNAPNLIPITTPVWWAQ